MEMKAQQQLTREKQEETLGQETYADVSSKNIEGIDPLSQIDFSA